MSSSDALRAWRAAGRTFAHRGHSIFYRDDGAGDDVVVAVHGFPTASFDWAKMWPGLTKRFRVIAPDLIGFGFSAKPAEYDYSIADQATLVEELLASLRVNRAHLLAHDYGDTVAQELLARLNEKTWLSPAALSFRSVTFLNGGLFPETHRPRFIQRLLRSPVGALVARLSSEASFRASFTAIFGRDTRPTDEELRDFWALVHENNGERNFHKLIGYMSERREHRKRWVGALVAATRAGIPLRVIDGAADPVSGAHMVARYQELVPKPDVVLLDGIGHYPQVEAPEKVLEHFLAFVDSARSAPAPTAAAAPQQPSTP